MKFRVVQSGLHYELQYKQFLLWQTVYDGTFPARFGSSKEAFAAKEKMEKKYC